MSTRTLAISAFALIALVIGAAFLLPETQKPSFIASKSENFCRSCASVLSDRLKAPATFQRVDCPDFDVKPATLEEYMGWNWPENYARDIRKAQLNRRHWDLQDTMKKSYSEGRHLIISTTMTYDAANSFGTPIRETAICELVTIDEAKVVDTAGLSLRVNGETKLEWSVRQATQ